MNPAVPPLRSEEIERLPELRFAPKSLPSAKVMPLRPPSFRFVLALVGACLILWGGKGEVLFHEKISQSFSLLAISRNGGWTILGASVCVVALTLLRYRWPAWVPWLIAVGTFSYLCVDLLLTVRQLSQTFAESEALMGFKLPDLTGLLKDTKIKPGAVAILAGFLIQMVGLMLVRRTKQK